MEISTQTSASAARLLEIVLVDRVQVYNVGQPQTTGPVVSRSVEASGEPVAALVQPLGLPNDAEGRSVSPYSVKVGRNTPLQAGQAVKVLRCVDNAALEGLFIFIDTMNYSRIRKGTGKITQTINREGKEGLA